MTDPDHTLDLFTAPPAEPRIWSVQELNRTIRGVLESALPPLWVAGEVANWTRARSGHCYFTLKDDRAQLRCVMWRNQAARLPMDPEEGMRIRVHGALTLYEARGDMQFTVQEVEAEGKEGLWKLAFERLRAKLEAEGLLDPSRKRPIPRIPRTVGVVTSPTGAAFRDILSVIGRRAPWTRVVIRGARVQGEGAAAEIAEAIRVLAGSGEVDLLIVGRGGGSLEDLWAFNEEPVVRAIAECPLPVISAVGHEVDVTLSDLVADLRAPTPSAAAEGAVLDGAALLEMLRTVRPRLARGLRGQVEGRTARVRELRVRSERALQRLAAPRRARLDRVTHRLAPALRGLLAPRRTRLERSAEGVRRGMAHLLRDRRRRMEHLAGQLEALSPLAILTRGYAVAFSLEGKVLRRVEDFPPKGRFQLQVADGRVEARVEKTKKENEGEG